MDLYLVRHGESLGNRDRLIQTAATELSPTGLAQAEATGRWLARYFAERAQPPTALYSSDLSRAWQTAEIIGQHLSLIPIPDPGLREKHAGDAEGKTLDECRVLYPDHWNALSAFDLEWGWPGGESRRQMRDRVVPAVQTIVARHAPDDQIVIVTHGGPIWAYLSGAVGGVPSDLTDSGRVLHNCGATHVHIPHDGSAPGAACLLALSQHEHLPNKE